MTLVLGALLLLCVAITVRPFLRPRETAPEATSSVKLRELQYRKELLIAHIRDAEAEYATGKLSKEDFDDVILRYKLEAVDLMKRISQLETGEDAHSTVEREISDLKRTRGGLSSSEAPSEPWTLCPKCGYENSGESAFCAQCGRRLSRGE